LRIEGFCRWDTAGSARASNSSGPGPAPTGLTSLGDASQPVHRSESLHDVLWHQYYQPHGVVGDLGGLCMQTAQKTGAAVAWEVGRSNAGR